MKFKTVLTLTSLSAIGLMYHPAQATEFAYNQCMSNFESSDSNQDGVLSPEEFELAWGSCASEIFDIADTNDDGVISHEEFSAACRANYMCV